MLHVLVLLGRAPGRARREALRLGADSGGAAAAAFIVVGIHAARVIGVVLLLLHVAHQIGAAIDDTEVADLAVDGQRGVLELILVEGRIVELH